jgi:predicted DNA binding CopG/RHH family protein
MEKVMKTYKIPQIDSIEELAQFWDTHDLTDFEDELEEVTETVFERKSETVMKIRLQPQEIEAVKRIAQLKGIGDSDLIREWVLEKIRTF